MRYSDEGLVITVGNDGYGDVKGKTGKEVEYVTTFVCDVGAEVPGFKTTPDHAL